MKLINVVGARPNFMKIAPLMMALKNHNTIQVKLIHTGQHYDERMSALFFRELAIPAPDVNLGIGSGTQTRQIAEIMIAFEEVCLLEKPDAILVVGDVNSCLACSLVAAKLGIQLIHLEAGLRSFDRTMPEEINRLVTDTLANILLAPSDDAVENLRNEGIAETKIHLVGNIMIDTLLTFLPLAKKSNISQKLDVVEGEYVIVTLHRPSNVDESEALRKILRVLQSVSEKCKIIFPIHPRTLKNIHAYGLESLLNNIIITEPLGYLEFQKLMSEAKLVISDSGGVQEETTVLGIPCLTLRNNTERPVTVTLGTNYLVSDVSNLEPFVEMALNNTWKTHSIPRLWDGKTALRVVKLIENL